MNFNSHSELEGRHAFLSASKYHWINYDEDKLARTYMTALAAAKGTELHDIAASLIKNNINLPRTDKTLNLYVNDAIGFRMEPERILFYSPNAFGTADAISFRKGKLRIHDLKTGETRTSFHQLEVYVAFFCLEYGLKPAQIKTELRIYQNDSVQTYEPDVDDITRIMDKTVSFDRRIDEIRSELLS